MDSEDRIRARMFAKNAEGANGASSAMASTLARLLRQYEESLQAAEKQFEERDADFLHLRHNYCDLLAEHNRLKAAVEAYREQRHGGKTTFTATATEAAMYRAARGEA